MTRLCDDYNVLYKRGKIDKELPSHILDNLSPDKPLRPYQEKAFAYYLDYMQSPPSNIHLLFQMATGSGKTLIMAGLICDLYKRGYRHFIFFVSSKTIIQKTKDNFLNTFSPKYLLNQNIVIDDKKVLIHEVPHFSQADENNINIYFTTTQGLHDHLNSTRENGITYADFENKKIALISDEAHHSNASTKKKGSINLETEATWESTVFRLFETSPDNILLEFTATLDLRETAIREKYEDKILYQYSLKEFREDQYSKDVELLHSDQEPLERALGAILLSQYRLKLASSQGLHLKPIVLMKSRSIHDSNSFENQFHSCIEQLTGTSLKSFHDTVRVSILNKAFEYLLHEYSYDDLARELKGDFSRDKCVSVNSENESEENQLLVNSLEAYNNHIRIVFAVDKLNEGWDVLNLFDIVRLYDTRESKKNGISITTNAEAQLIGRGARYYPFTLTGGDDTPEQRKFDQDRNNPLRMLEMLYYHCSHNPQYIDDLKSTLEKEGLLPLEQKTITVKLKDSFKQTQFYKTGFVFANQRVKNERATVTGFEDYNIPTHFTFDRLQKGKTASISAFDKELDSEPCEIFLRTISLKEFSPAVIRHALDTIPFYTFKTLQNHFPALNSIRLFTSLEGYLNTVTVTVNTPTEKHILTRKEQLKVTQFVLKEIKGHIERNSFDEKGSEEFIPALIQDVFKDKTINIQIDPNSKRETGRPWDKTVWGFELKDEDWFVYEDNHGTSEEKSLIRFIYTHRHTLQQHYSEFYLIRNEGDLKLYNFEDGKGFMPDFILFLCKHGENGFEALQFFIEPKGDHLLDVDAWKEAFLKDILYTQHFGGGASYHVQGLPFYNKNREQGFKENFLPKIMV